LAGKLRGETCCGWQKHLRENQYGKGMRKKKNVLEMGGDRVSRTLQLISFAEHFCPRRKGGEENRVSKKRGCWEMNESENRRVPARKPNEPPKHARVVKREKRKRRRTGSSFRTNDKGRRGGHSLPEFVASGHKKDPVHREKEPGSRWKKKKKLTLDYSPGKNSSGKSIAESDSPSAG